MKHMKTKNVFLSFAFVIFSLGFIYVQNDTPKVNISEKNSGNITLGEIVGQQLIVEKEGFVVVSFSIFVQNNEASFTIDVAGNIVNKNASNQIRMQPDGTRIVFKNIIISSDGKTMSVPEMKFILI
jgi:hypothetical protein